MQIFAACWPGLTLFSRWTSEKPLAWCRRRLLLLSHFDYLFACTAVLLAKFLCL